MKVKELIEILKFRDQEAEVIINVKAKTRVYGTQMQVTFVDSAYGGCSINASLPDGTTFRETKGRYKKL